MGTLSRIFDKIGRFDPHLITVEPVLFLFAMCYGILVPTDKALIYRKVCIQQYNLEVCDNLVNETYRQQENFVQQESSRWNFYISVSSNIPSIIMTLFYGALSDKYERRMPIFLPPIGLILRSFISLIASINMNINMGILILGHLFYSIFGSKISLFSTCLSYLGATVTREQRTCRISLAQSAFLVGNMISHFLSGIILKNTSFQFVYGFCMLDAILIFPYTILWMRKIYPNEQMNNDKDSCQDKEGIDNPVYEGDHKDIPDKVEEIDLNSNSKSIDAKQIQPGDDTGPPESHHKASCEFKAKTEDTTTTKQRKISLLKLLSPRNIIDSFNVTRRRRTDRKRMSINLLLVGLFFHTLATSAGEYGPINRHTFVCSL